MNKLSQGRKIMNIGRKHISIKQGSVIIDGNGKESVLEHSIIVRPEEDVHIESNHDENIAFIIDKILEPEFEGDEEGLSNLINDVFAQLDEEDYDIDSVFKWTYQDIVGTVGHNNAVRFLKRREIYITWSVI